MKTLRCAVILLLLAWTGEASAKGAKKRGATAIYEPLPIAQIAKLKKQPCAFVHVWATWCTVCLHELPDLLKVLAVEKRINPVIIDVSSPFVQDNFSKKWMATLKPAFKVYLKPEGKDDVYMEAIDKEFAGTLPYTVLYHKGARLKSWTGSLDIAKVRAEVLELCK